MAHSAFSTNLNRLRSILSNKELILLRKGRLTLNPKYCWVDTWVFENLLKEAEKLLVEGDRKMAMAKYEDALALYKGPFMSGESLKHWAVFLRERLSLRYLRALMALGGALEEDGKYEKAIEWYETGLEANSLEEAFYQRLIRCHGKLGRHADVVRAYRRCKDTLSGKLDVSPSEETERMYKTVMASRPGIG
jgi:LuxR family maltose regulon positive regulatory protein